MAHSGPTRRKPAGSPVPVPHAQAALAARPDSSALPVAQVILYSSGVGYFQREGEVEEVHGAGQQQLRHYWANLAAYHLNLWMHTLVELWAWEQSPAQLSDRRRSPWDNPERRPSHADRCKALRRRCIQEEIRGGRVRRRLPRKVRGLVRRLLNLVA